MPFGLGCSLCYWTRRKNSFFQRVYLCFSNDSYIKEQSFHQTTVTVLNRVNRLICVIDKQCVFTTAKQVHWILLTEISGLNFPVWCTRFTYFHKKQCVFKYISSFENCKQGCSVIKVPIYVLNDRVRFSGEAMIILCNVSGSSIQNAQIRVTYFISMVSSKGLQNAQNINRPPSLACYLGAKISNLYLRSSFHLVYAKPIRPTGLYVSMISSYTTK